MRLGRLFASAGIYCPEKYKNIEYTTVASDSRKVVKGSIFVAVKGHNNDGHDYIENAIKNGASVIVAEQVRDECVGGAAAIILVDNTARAAARLYNEHYKYPSKDIKIVAVTGTNGKSSVCFMLESIFLEAGCRCATLGTLGLRVLGEQSSLCATGLTTPSVAELYPLLAKLREMGITHLFMEVSSHALAQDRVRGLEFECGVFTNLSRDHLDFHGDMEKYFLTKASLFDSCKKKIVYADSEYARRLSAMYGDIFACSRERGDLTAKNIRTTLDGCSYTLGYKNGEYQISLGALGDFSVSNSMCAAAVALEEEIPVQAVARGLARFSGAEGRMERVVLDGAPFCVIIDFAHTPDALENVLSSVRSMANKSARIVTLFGCGGERDRGKRRMMGAIASKMSDLTVVTSDNSRSEPPENIISEILKGIDKEKPYKVIIERESAIEYAMTSLRAGDILLLCGKGHERYIEDASGKKYFDERKIVRDCYDRMKIKSNLSV